MISTKKHIAATLTAAILTTALTVPAVAKEDRPGSWTVPLAVTKNRARSGILAFHKNQCRGHFLPLGASRGSVSPLPLQPPQYWQVQAGIFTNFRKSIMPGEKTKFALRTSPETQQLVKEMCSLDNCRLQSERQSVLLAPVKFCVAKQRIKALEKISSFLR